MLNANRKSFANFEKIILYYPWPAEKIVISKKALAQCGDFLLKKSWKKLLIIADQNTFAACGEALIPYISGDIEKIIYEELSADIEEAKILATKLSPYDAVIAIGSGSVSDLCKYASFLAKKPYVMVGTAPSMNGYLSQNASLWQNGCKITCNAHGPSALFFDTQTLANSPRRLISSGVADLLCFSTCYIDWFLSHKVLGTNFLESSFSDLRPVKNIIIENIQAIKERNEDAIAYLMLALLISGNSMVLAKGSYPASQGEHLIAHAYDMLNPQKSINWFHGESIAITSIYMAKLQKKLLSQKIPAKINFYSDEKAKSFLSAFFPASTCDSCAEEYQKKFEHHESIEQLQSNLNNNWQEIISAWQRDGISTTILKNIFLKLEIPTNPSDLGWMEEKFSDACSLAPLIRSRFTFLDLA
jgi:glycerol-1-phosphate dehydrogenase [NAD(P)+]